MRHITSARHPVSKVFTPATAARLNFVERESLNKRLANSLSTPGKQIVVYGRTGSGKTTLLVNKLSKIYDTHISVSCGTAETFEECKIQAFDKLSPYYKEIISTDSSDKKKRGLSAKYLGIKASLESDRTKRSQAQERRILPAQLSIESLAQLMGEARACWILEDFHKLPDEEKPKLAKAMKHFMDAAKDFPTLRIIAVGAVETARQVVNLEPEMWNRVAEIEVPMMTNEEIQRIVSRGETLLKIVIPFDQKEDVTYLANGIPAVCHQICLNLCLSADIKETCSPHYKFTRWEFSGAVHLWLQDASDSLKEMYDRSTRTIRKAKYDNCRIILECLASFGRSGATRSDMLARIRERFPSYSSGSLTRYLKQLVSELRCEVIMFEEPSGRYLFKTPLLHTYFRMQRHADTSETRASRYGDTRERAAVEIPPSRAEALEESSEGQSLDPAKGAGLQTVFKYSQIVSQARKDSEKQ